MGQPSTFAARWLHGGGAAPGGDAAPGGGGHGSTESTVAAHAALMFVAFGLLMPAGAGVARYCGSTSWWFQFHKACQGLGWLLGMAGFVLAWSAVARQEGTAHLSVPHHQLGFVAVLLAAALPFVALARPDKGAHGRAGAGRGWRANWWSLLHRGGGRLCVALGLANVCVGVAYHYPQRHGLLVAAVLWAALAGLAVAGRLPLQLAGESPGLLGEIRTSAGGAAEQGAGKEVQLT